MPQVNFVLPQMRFEACWILNVQIPIEFIRNVEQITNKNTVYIDFEKKNNNMNFKVWLQKLAWTSIEYWDIDSKEKNVI